MGRYASKIKSLFRSVIGTVYTVNSSNLQDTATSNRIKSSPEETRQRTKESEHPDQPAHALGRSLGEGLKGSGTTFDPSNQLIAAAKTSAPHTEGSHHYERLPRPKDGIPSQNPSNGAATLLSSMHKESLEIESLADEICEALQKRKKSSCFFQEDLDFIWEITHFRRFYENQSWYDAEWDLSTFMKGYRKVMSILILVHFKNWKDFRRLFIDRKLADDALPFESEDLDFLGIFREDFYEKQWAFCPQTIREQKETVNLNDLRLLPFLSEPQRIAEGAHSFVTKGMIAKGYLEYDNHTVNSRPKAVAVKRIADKHIQKAEFDNLVDLRRCLSGHQRIMVNLATLCNRSQNFHYLIYDLAAYDLGVFLTKDPAGMRSARHATASPERTNSKDLWPGNLISESSSLSDALDYLHKRLYTTTRIALAHNDIKPENILVMYPDSHDVKDRYPAGKWKIADFGLSKIKETSENKHLSVDSASPLLVKMTERTHRQESLSYSKTVPKRDPGRYTAPELDRKPLSELELIDARKADIWSFGCVLSEVLAYAVRLQPKDVDNFRTALGHGYQDMRFYDVTTKDVKPSFPEYLETLINQAHKDRKEGNNIQWVKQFVDLLKETVVTDVSSRPSAAKIRDGLRKILGNMSEEKGLWLEHKSLQLDTALGTCSPGPGNASAVESPEEMAYPKPEELINNASRTSPSIVVSDVSGV